MIQNIKMWICQIVWNKVKFPIVNVFCERTVKELIQQISQTLLLGKEKNLVSNVCHFHIYKYLVNVWSANKLPTKQSQLSWCHMPTVVHSQTACLCCTCFSENTLRAWSLLEEDCESASSPSDVAQSQSDTITNDYELNYYQILDSKTLYHCVTLCLVLYFRPHYK